MRDKIGRLAEKWFVRTLIALLFLALSFSTTNRAQAVQYSTAASTWCNSTLRASLNSTTYLSLMNYSVSTPTGGTKNLTYADVLKQFSNSDSLSYNKLGYCSSGLSYIRLIAQGEWNAKPTGQTETFGTIYKKVVTPSTNIWALPTSASTTTAVTLNTSSNTETANVAVTTSTNDAYPMVQLACSGTDCETTETVNSKTFKTQKLCVSNGGSSGTTADPYILTTYCNDTPIADISTYTTGTVVTKASGITIKGKFSDPDLNQQQRITVKLTDPSNSSKTYSKSTSWYTATSAKNDADWSLTFTLAELANLGGGTYTGANFTYTIEDNNCTGVNNSITCTTDSNTYNADKTLIIDRTAPTCGTWKVVKKGTSTQVNCGKDGALSSTCAANDNSTTTYANNPNAIVLPWDAGQAYTATLSPSDTGGAGLPSGTTYSCEIAAGDASSCTVTVTDQADNSVICRSPLTRQDKTDPVPACTVEPLSGYTSNVYQSDTTNKKSLYYNSNTTSGRFRLSVKLDSSVSDPPSKLSNVNFTDPDGSTTVWSVNPTTASYSTTEDQHATKTTDVIWSGSAKNNINPSATLYTNAGVSKTCTDITVYADGAAPTGFSMTYGTSGVKYINKSTTDFALTLNVTHGSDNGGSGINESGYVLYRYVGTLSNNGCSGWGSAQEVNSNNYTLNYTSGNLTSISLKDIRKLNNTGSNANYATAICYKYGLVAKDNVGNTSSPFISDSLVKIDLDVPTCGVWSETNWSTTYASNASTTVYTDAAAVKLPWNKGTAYSATLTETASNDAGGSGLQQLVFQNVSIEGKHKASNTVTVKDNAGNQIVCQTPFNQVDTSSYPISCTISVDTTSTDSYKHSASNLTYANYFAPSGNAYTIYYNPQTGTGSGDAQTGFSKAGGKFTATTTSEGTPLSGIYKVHFPALVSQAAGDVSTPVTTGGRAYSRSYTWTSSTTLDVTNGTSTIYYNNDQANPVSGSTCNYVVRIDKTAPPKPSSGYLGYSDTFTSKTKCTDINSNGCSLGVTYGDFADTGAGTKTIVIQRRVGSLSGGACTYSGDYSTPDTSSTNWVRDYSTVSSGATIYVNDTFTSGNCYQYRVVAIDNVGNASYTYPASNASFKVSTSDPSNTIYNVSTPAGVNQDPGTALPAHVYWATGTKTIYYGVLTAQTPIVITSEAQDPAAGIDHVTYRELSGTITHNATSIGNNRYTSVDNSTSNQVYTLPANYSTTHSNVPIVAYTQTGTQTPNSFTLQYDNVGPGNAEEAIGFTNCPSAGITSIDNLNYYFIGSSHPLAWTYGKDSLSGRDDTSTYVQVKTGALNPTTGQCDYGSNTYSVVSATAYTTANKLVNTYTFNFNSGTCYSYQVVASDRVGNQSTSQACEFRVDYTIPMTGSTEANSGCDSEDHPEYWRPVEVYPWHDSDSSAQTFELVTFWDSGSVTAETGSGIAQNTTAHPGTIRSYGTNSDETTTTGFKCTASNTNGASCTVTLVDRAGNKRVCKSPINRRDDANATTNPVTCTITEGTNPEYQYYVPAASSDNGKETIYFNATDLDGTKAADGSTFNLNLALDEPISGIHRNGSSTAAVDGIAFADLPTGWTKSTYSGSAGSYDTTYTWVYGATGQTPATSTITFGNTHTSTCDITVIADTNKPVGGALNYQTGRSTTTDDSGTYFYLAKGDSQIIDLQLIRATDVQSGDSGIDESTWEVWRYQGNLSDNTCDFTGATAKQIYPLETYDAQGKLTNFTATDTLSTGKCYTFELRVKDNVGNQGVFANSVQVRVDTTAPTCGTDWDPSIVPWKSEATTQYFKLYNKSADHANGSTDAHSGLAGTYFDCTAAASNGATCYAVVTDRAGNTRSCRSPQNRIDTGSGDVACEIEGKEGTYVIPSASVIYYNPSLSAGSFWLTATNQATSTSGIESFDFPALADNAAVNVPTSESSYTRKDYAWSTSNDTQLYNQPVTINFANGTSSTCQVSAIADQTGPVGPDLGYQSQLINDTENGQTISLGITAGSVTDAGVGVDTWEFQYQIGTLGSDDTCAYSGDTYQTFSTANHDDLDGTVYLEDFVFSQNESCYRFRVKLTDKLKNVSYLDSANSILVQKGRPSIVIAGISQPEGVYYPGGDTAYFRRPDSNTSIVVATDVTPPSDAGIKEVTFQNLVGSSTVSDTTRPYSQTYIIPGGSTSSYLDRVITAYTDATDPKTASVSFNFIYDGEGPQNASFASCPGSDNSGYVTANSFSLSASYGTDSLSGLNTAASYIDARQGTLNNGVCTYAADWSAASDYGETNLSVVGATNACYSYRVASYDNVGNVSYSPVCEIKVDLVDPVCSTGTWVPAAGSFWNTSEVGQYFTLSGVTDDQSGMAVAGGNCTTGTQHGDTCEVTVSDNAGRTVSCTSPANQVDTAAPELVCTLEGDASSTDYWHSTTAGTNPVLYFNGNNYGDGTANGKFHLYATTDIGRSGVVTPAVFSDIASGWTKSDYTQELTSTTAKFSQAYSWTSAGATGNSVTTVDVTYGNGLSSQCSVAILADSAEPLGSAPNYGTMYLGESGSKLVTINLTRGTSAGSIRDLASGINEGSWAVYRRAGTLSGNQCTYADSSSFQKITEPGGITTTTTGDEVSAVSIDFSKLSDYASGVCYQLQLSVKDNVQNTTTFSLGGEVRVDLDKPLCAPTGSEPTWDPDPSPWKSEAVYQTFELLSAVDELTNVTSSFYTCVAEATSEATCKVTVSDIAGNTTECESPENNIDISSPKLSCYIEDYTGNSSTVDGSDATLYYNNYSFPNDPGVAWTDGHFYVHTTVEEIPPSGISYLTFPALGSTSEQVVTDPDAGTVASYTGEYFWNATTTESKYNVPVVATYGNTNTNACTVSFILDDVAPIGVAPKYRDTYLAQTGTREISLGVTGSDFKDEGVGTMYLFIQRIKGELKNGECVNWESWIDTLPSDVLNQPEKAAQRVGNFDGDDMNDDSILKVTDQIDDLTCYKYRIAAQDKLNNYTFFETDSVFMVDSSKPEINITTILPESGTSAYYFNDSSTAYYGPAAGNSITVNTAAYSLNRDVKSIGYENLTSRHTYASHATSGRTPTDSMTFDISGLSQDVRDLHIFAADTADASGSAYYDLIYDDEGPTGSRFTTCPSDYISSDNFTISGVYGTDVLSGLSEARGYSHMERATAPLVNGRCVYDESELTWETITSDSMGVTWGLTDYWQTDAANATCYLYRMAAVDHVANVGYSDICEVKVDTDNPTCGTWQPAEVNPWNTAGGQTFTLIDSSDATSGIRTAGGQCTTLDYTGSTCTVDIEDNAGNTRACVSPVNKVDGVTPDITCSIDLGDNAEYQHTATVSGTPTLYYNNGRDSEDQPITGSFTLGVTLEEPPSHVVSKTFPAINTGWTGSNEASASGYYTRDYAWSDGALGNTRAPVVFTYGNGTTSQCNIAVIPDRDGPVDAALSYPQTYINSTSSQIIDLGLVRPTDAASGIDEDSWQIYRRTGTLSSGVCTYAEDSEYEEISPQLTRDASGRVTAIASTDTLSNGYCYSFQLRVSDNVGNQSTVTATNDIMVDLTPPTCGTTWEPAEVAWKNTPSSQTFTLTGSTDGLSGIGAASFSCTTAETNGARCLATIYDVAGNTTTCQSPANRVDTGSTPELACQIIAGSGYSYLPSSSIIYYNPSASVGTGTGTFTVRTTAASMPSSGIAYVTFPALASEAARDSSSSAVGQPTVYDRLYTWDTTATTAAPNAPVRMTYGNANSRTCSVSAIPDYTAPSAPATLKYQTQVTNRVGSRSIALGISQSDVTDNGAGVDSWTIQRALGSWTYNPTTNSYSCSGYGPYINIGTYDADSLNVEELNASDTLDHGSCYRYQVLITDRVGNVATVTSTNDIIVDKDSPEISIDSVTSTVASGYYFDQVRTIYYADPSASGTDITVTTLATENNNGIAKVTYTDLSGSGKADATKVGTTDNYYRTYTLIAGTSSNYTDRQASASANVTGRYATTDFDVIYDGTKPSEVYFATCPAGYQSTGSYSLKGSYGADSGSGLDLTSSYIVEQKGSLSGGTCQYAIANPTLADFADTTNFTVVASAGSTDYSGVGESGDCYRYFIVSYDKVGNYTISGKVGSDAATTTCEIKFDRDDPECGNVWDPVEVKPWNTSTTIGQTFELKNPSDALSGLKSGLTYTCTTAATTGSTCTVTLEDNAGNTKICTSPENKVDPSSPELTCTISGGDRTGAAADYQYLTTYNGYPAIYYSSYDEAADTGRTGKFTLTTKLAEPTSGITAMYYPPLDYPGLNYGWSTDPATGAYGSAGTYQKVYTWAAQSSSSTATESSNSAQVVVYTYGNANQGTCAFYALRDNDAPTFSLAYPEETVNNYSVINLALTGPTDGTGSGIDDSTWTVKRRTGTTVDDGSGNLTCNFGTATYTDTDFNYSAGTLTASSAMSNGHCYQYQASVTDNVGNTATIEGANIVYAVYSAPDCSTGTWTPADPVDWKGVASRQLFTLTGIQDAAGMEKDSYSCTADAYNGAKCSVEVTNNIGVSSTCWSPANRIDLDAPELTATEPEATWQTVRQNLLVSAVDLDSGLARLAYSWNSDILGDTCTGGYAIASGTNIGATIPEGENTLYLCAIDNVGNVTAKTYEFYRYSSTPDYVDIIDNVEADEFTWNVRLDSMDDEHVLVEGYIPAQDIAKTYHLTLVVKDHPEISGSTDVTTIPGKQTGFTIRLAVADFNLSPTNYTFPGPHTLYITDDFTGNTISKAYNITFYFPLANTLHRSNSSAYMIPTDTRLN